MKSLLIAACAVVGLTLLGSRAAFAQSKDARVHFRDHTGRDEAVSGQIRKESLSEITVKPNNGLERKIPVASVVDVEYPIPSFQLSRDLRTARNNELAGKLDQALKQYHDLLPRLPDSPLKRHTEYTVARLTARSADTDASQLKSAIDLLQAFKTKYPDCWELASYPELLIPLQLRAGDTAGAQKSLAELAALPGLPPERRLECQIQSVKLLAAQDKIAEAEKRILDLARTLPADDPQALRLRITLAECWAAGKRLPDAEKELQAILAKTNNPDLKAYAYNALGEAYERGGDPRKAMWNFLFVDVMYNQNKQEHARALYHLYKVFRDLKDDKKAQQCRDLLEKDKQLAGRYQDLILKEK